jgi:peptidoglycan/LPS O-acetylase OafA/YrhL
MYLNEVLKREGNNFDIFRLAAALAVIVGHAYAIAPQPPLQDGVLGILHFDYSGSLAVKFFFFLSGLLVTNSIISRPNPFHFLTKRAFRIFPGLLVCLLISVFIIGPLFTKLTLSEYFTNSDTWRYLYKNIFLMDMIWRLPGVFTESPYGLNGSLWTLPHEVLCYIYLAVFFGLALLQNKIVSNIFFISVIIAAFVLPQFLPHFFYQNPEARLLPGCFAMGALIANNKSIILVNLQGAALLWVLMFLLKSSAAYQFLFYVAFFYSILYISSLPFVVQKLKLPFDASYGVYIYGFMIQQCIHALFPGLGVHGNQIVSAGIAVGMGILSWYFVEKRFIELGHKIFNKNLSFNAVQKAKQLFTKINSGSYARWLTENRIFMFIVFTVLALVVHAIVLKFIFPGYYQPLSPHHSDFYLPAAFANAPGEYYSFKSLLSWPRPVYLMVAKLFGYFGIYGGIACIITLVAANCALTVLFLNRILKLSFSGNLVLLFLTYCYLLFSQPFFYTFYSQDLGAHLSYFFLVAGGYLYYLTFRRSTILANFTLLCFAFLAFLSKETYGLTSLFFAFLWFIYYRKASILKAMLPFLMIAIAFILAFTINVLIKSVFVDLNASANAPYHISLNPVTVMREWIKYAVEAMNVANLAMIGILGYLVFTYKADNRKELIYLFIGFMVGTVLSWLPNAILPNHHYKGYSFNGAYLFYLPLFFLTIFWRDKPANKRIMIAAMVLCLASPLLNQGKYKDIHNTWTLIQENNQRNLLRALDKQMKNINPAVNSQRILIQGITFPFQPFTYPEALRVFPNARFANFDVVNYNAGIPNNQKSDLVTFISPSDTSLVNYDQKWIFDNDGNLVKSENFVAEKVWSSAMDSSKMLQINYESLSQFGINGFYDQENGIRWTNGNASIDLKSIIENNDTIMIRLNTYLPPVSKDIVPKIVLTDTDNRTYETNDFTRNGDVFYYLFFLSKKPKIKRISIFSKTIDASPDQRTLSFPFISLEITGN